MRNGESFHAPLRAGNWDGPFPDWALRWQFPEPVSYLTAGKAIQAAIGRLRDSGHYWLSPVPCFREGSLYHTGAGNPAEGCGEFLAFWPKAGLASADWALVTADWAQEMRDADSACDALEDSMLAWIGERVLSAGAMLMPVRLLCAAPDDVRSDSTVRHFVKEDGEYVLLNSFF